MEVLTTLKNTFQSLKKKIINPIGDYLHDYCVNRYITYLQHEERTRDEIAIIGLPINERYLGYISHIIAVYKMVDLYYSYYNIAMWCSTTVIACAKYFYKVHRD